MSKLRLLLEDFLQTGGSDLHLVFGEIPRARTGPLLDELGEKPVDEALQEELTELFGGVVWEPTSVRERTFTISGQYLVGILIGSLSTGYSATFRKLGSQIPPIEVVSEGAEEHFQSLRDATSGLIIFSGATGSGKWTTAASLLNDINLHRATRIIVLEAHPNYPFKSEMGLVTQIHLGTAHQEYEKMLEIVHQLDVDVIGIDNIPTAETLRQVVTLARQGKLIIANLPADSLEEAISTLSRGLLSLGFEDIHSASWFTAISHQKLMSNPDRGRSPVYEMFLPA